LLPNQGLLINLLPLLEAKDSSEIESIVTTQKIAAIRCLVEDTSNYIRLSLPKIVSYELVQVIFEQPYCRINNLVEKGVAKRQTASVYLKQLVEIGVLKEQQVGKEKLFVHPKLVCLMTQDSNEFQPYV